jgi:XTP/dITP diphosphohydrolase
MDSTKHSIAAEIIVATGNNGKFREIKEIFDGLPCRLLPMREYWNPVPSIEETGSTFYENACIKADWVYQHASVPALADDSGLIVDALGGAPGVRSARYAGLQGDAAANNARLLQELQGVAFELRTARFVCSVVLRIDNAALLHAEGRCEGRIIETPRGSGGFGYDPLFVPDGFDRTFAELTNEEKHHISHRGRALKALKERLHAYFAM